jgi:hypothetical protein
VETRWVACPMTPAQTLRKHLAIGLYKTQAGSIDPLMQSFARKNELFGIVTTTAWPPGEDVPSRVIIRDPPADRRLSASIPRGDIELVTMGRERGRLFLGVTTRGKVWPAIGYHVAIHGGGSNTSGRMIAQYDWRGPRSHGLVVRNGTLSVVSTQQLVSVASDRIANLEGPWPWPTSDCRFFTVRAWTTRGRRVIDQTATATFTVPVRSR